MCLVRLHSSVPCRATLSSCHSDLDVVFRSLVYAANPATRTFSDFETVTEAMNGICQLYEQRLKQMNPGVRNITYDITELYAFIDGLGDLCCLVYDGQSAYQPHNKQWVKDRVYQHLKRMAQ
jgi:hypothetical protein